MTTSPSELTPAVDGWFAVGDDPTLLGGKCTSCKTFVFPPREGMCPNPACMGQHLDEVALSRRGTVWSYATNHYPPPPPAVVTAPYTVVAVTLAAEMLTVLGLLHGDASPNDLRVGSEVELCLESLNISEEPDHPEFRAVWAWRPAQEVAR